MPGYAEQDPTFAPAMRLITGITNASQCTITTSFDHGYQTGLIVRILIPDEFGMRQLNKQTGQIVDVPTDDTFVLAINTVSYDTFIVPDPEPWYLNDYAVVVPVGEINAQLTQAVKNQK